MTTFWELVEQRAAETPDAITIGDDGGASVTARELRDRAELVAFRLAARGVEPGACVSWILPSTVDAVVLLCALARLGAVQNPIVPIYGAREVAFITGHVGSSMLITPGVFRGIDFTDMARGVAKDVDLEVVEFDELRTGPTRTVPTPTDVDAVRWIFATSGTTADPKCVKHTDRTVIAAGRALAPIGLERGSRWGGAVPVTHVAGPTVLALALTVGASMHFIRIFDARAACETLRVWGCDVVAGVGALVSAMLEYPRHDGAPAFPALRVLAAGGGPKLPGLLERVSRELECELVPSYGMTECPYATAAAIDDPLGARAEGEGRPTVGVDLRIVDEDEQVLGRGEEGEIRVRGPQLFVGYVDPVLDAEAFDADGFFRTGDLGFVAEGGHLVVTGRLKEIIVRNGENLGVRSIEDLLLRHPDVADATVIGLPDPVTGERVCAVVVPVAGATITLESVRAYCEAEALMRQKWPEQLEIVEGVPRNAMGKAVKPELQRRFGG